MLLRLIIIAVFTILLSACVTASNKFPLSPELAALDKRLADESSTGPNFRSSKIYHDIKSDFTSEDLRLLSDRGNIMATVILGTYLRYEADYKGASAAYLKACQAGNSIGCVNMGSNQRLDVFRVKDAGTSYEFYDMACKAGNALGCRLLGGLYHRGIGVEKDLKTAFELWSRSCDIGNYFGCNDLGTLYDKGQYVEEDNKRAEELFRYGCDGGMKWGCSNLEKVQREIARETNN